MRHVLATAFTLTFLLYSALHAAASTRVSLTFPDCFPQCDGRDQQRLLAAGTTESQTLAAIGQAKSEIRFSVYTFSRQPIFAALIAAQEERGVRIRGVVDRAQLTNLQPYCHDGRCDLSTSLPEVAFATMSLRERMAALAPLEIYQKATLAGKLQLLSWKHEDMINIQVGQGSSRLMHHKFLIVDDSILQTSSGNWSSTAMSVNFENTLEYRAPEDAATIADFACAFEAIASRTSLGVADRLVQCQRTNAIYFTPASTTDNIESLIFQSIDRASQTIDIAMHHLVHPGVYERLEAAAQRGLRIRMLFDDDDCPNWTPPLLFRLATGYQDTVAVRYLPTQCKINQLSHNRFGIFDGQVLVNGSANWSLAGLRSNYENFQIYRDAGVIASFSAQFERLYAAALSKSDCHCKLDQASCRERYCRGEFSPFHRGRLSH